MSFPPSAKPRDDIERVLVVFAHPDDVDFGASGTVAGWVADGLQVTYLIVTRGDAGGFDATPREDMPALREAEQRAAAAAVGVTEVHFLEGYSDGTLTPSLELRKEITRAIRRYRPDRILTSSPLRRWDRMAGPSHPDHLAVGEATTCAIYPDARNEFAHPDLLADGLAPWVVKEVWYSGGPNPDHLVDITDVLDYKMAALRAHVTQVSHMDLDDFVQSRLGAMSRALGMPEGRMGEAFNIFGTE